jgi:hypothetical protein
VHGVDPGQGAGAVGQFAHAASIDHGADGVRGPGERHHARAIGKLALEIVVVERGVIAQLDRPNHQVAVVGELEPGRHAAVVVQRRDEDLVAGLERTPRRAREHEVERGHVRPEDHLMRRAAEKARAVGLGPLKDLAHAPAGLIHRAQVRARLPQGASERVAHLVGDLRAARRIEERESLVQRREALAERGHVELVHHLSHLERAPSSSISGPDRLGKSLTHNAIARLVGLVSPPP